MLHLHNTSIINNAFIDMAQDLDIVIPKYNLPESQNNYCMTKEVCKIFI